MNQKLFVASLVIVGVVIYILLSSVSKTAPSEAQSITAGDPEFNDAESAVPSPQPIQQMFDSSSSKPLAPEKHNAGAWCIVEGDIEDTEIAKLEKALLEWDVERGDILLPRNDSNFETPNAAFLAPYVELDLQDLIAHARNDDMFALLTIMQRSDVPKKYRDNAARHLAILGNTSTAMSYLVIKEMTLANSLFKQEGEITERVKQHLTNSLAYVSYGLEQLDVTALRSYMIFVKGHKEGNYALDPEIVLSKQEMAKVESAKSQFVNYLNQKREEKYLPAIEEKTFPDVAVRSFESSLAIEYHVFGELLQASKNLESMGYDFENPPECTKRVLQNFS
jgi:hypothetical protein